MRIRHLLYPSELSSWCNRSDSNRRPPGITRRSATELRLLPPPAEHGTRRARRASRAKSPDPRPSEGGAVYAEIRSRMQAISAPIGCGRGAIAGGRGAAATIVLLACVALDRRPMGRPDVR